MAFPGNIHSKPDETRKPNNVFLTASEPHGRIVRYSDFKKLYICEQNELKNNDEPRRVIPLSNIGHNEAHLPAITSHESCKTNNWDALSKLAYNILKLSSCDQAVVINRSRNEIVRTDNKTQQKTIYRFPSNHELGVEPPLIEGSVLTNQLIRKNKIGRPRKRVMQAEIVQTSNNNDESLSAIKKPCTTKNSNDPPIKSIYSRFGRAIKPVKQLSLTNQRNSEVLNNFTDEARDLINDINDKNFKCNLKPSDLSPLPNADAKNIVEELKIVPGASSSSTERHIPPESICPTCKKIFLGRRLKRHFVDHPDHMTPMDAQNGINQPTPASPDDVSLFSFLVSKLQKSNLNEDQRADLFIHELNDLVEQLQLRSSRLIRNTSGLHLVTSRTARILGIPEGQYALDMTAIETTPEPEPSCLMSFELNALPVPSNNTRSLDYTTLSMDDTLTDEAAQKLNLSAGGKLLPPSEESLLRAVDDFVPPTGITKLVVDSNLINQPNGVTTTTSSSSTVDTIVPHYDHASDNAVEAVTMKTCNTGNQTQPILDLAVDFFQFNTKK